MKQLLERLKKDINVDYKAIPFWSWNAKLEPQELIRQIHWMKEHGMGGFFMHARTGLKTEYMSEEWFQCIGACTEEAEKIGMKAWLYDENGWPSGFAGGKLLEDEANRDMYILTKTGPFDPEATVSYKLDEDKLIRISGEMHDEEVLLAEKKDYLNLYIRLATSTADILNPEVVDKFIALTHEKYREYFGEKFSDKIEGFFTDEPQYYRNATAYTRMIAEYFSEIYQEDILDSLGLLFVEKEGYRTFRYRYWKGMQELMLQNYAKKIYDWCEAQNMKLTGHYVEEDSLGNQLTCCGGIMPFYEYEHIPGIDWLAKRANNELPVKQVSSVAAQLGKKQVISETFGCCGWDVTPWDLRRIAAFQYVNGVNLMCQHLIPYSEFGTRKHDYPAHFSGVNPWVEEDFLQFNDYFSRLGYLLCEGKEKVNVAMLHPIRSAYFGYKRELEKEGFGIAELNEQLMKACRMLSGANVAYHFLDETLLSKYGFVEDSKIGCGNCKYDYLVIPSIYTMDASTEKLLRAYIMQGGRVLLLNGVPEYLEGEKYEYSYLKSNCNIEEIISNQPYQVKRRDTEIYSTLRTINGVKFIYAMNASEEKDYVQSFSLKGSLHKVNLISLDTESIESEIMLRPGEDILLFIDDSCKVERKKKKLLSREKLIFENAQIEFNENYMLVDKVSYSLDGVTFSKAWPVSALFQKLLKERMDGEIYFKYEFEIRNIPKEIQLRIEESNLIMANLNGVPLTQTVPCEIDEHVVAYDISAYVKEGKNEFVEQVYWHESEDVYYALFGENVTESMRNCIVYDSELMPIYLAGQFGVYPTKEYTDSQDQGYVCANDFYIGKVPRVVSDPITEGLPFVRGPICMKQKIWLDKKDLLLRVEGFYHGATVYINGFKAGTLLFDKELDISDYIKYGENEVEVRFIIGNQNLLGTIHFAGDKSIGIGPWIYELAGLWDGDKSEFYHDYYELRKFYQC